MKVTKKNNNKSYEKYIYQSWKGLAKYKINWKFKYL